MTRPPLPYRRRPSLTHRFWLFSPEADDELMFFASAAERDTYAKEEIRHYVDPDDGWWEEVENMFAGEATHVVAKTVKGTKPANFDEMDEDERDEFWPYGDEFDEIVDYALEPLPEVEG
jgi:hypothetical protein